MTEKKHYLLILTLLAGIASSLNAQVELKLLLQPDGFTYTVFARSQSSWPSPPANLTHSAQVTIVAPTGTFQLDSLTSFGGTWELTGLIEHPMENPMADYVIFTLSGATQAIVYEAWTPVPLFSFENKNGCTGSLELMDPATDPFSPPNSLNVPAGNHISIEGAGGDAYLGNYDPGSANCFSPANCLLSYRLKATLDGHYEISILPSAAYLSADPIDKIEAAIKVPTHLFEVSNLESLLPGIMLLGVSSRFDAPAEDPEFDYIQLRLNAPGQGLHLTAGVEVPLFSFANGGSCQGDSIFLLQSDDPFLPPNTQGVAIAQQVYFSGANAPVVICTEEDIAAPCLSCLFTAGHLKIDSIRTADPVVCLGGDNGAIQIFAQGANSLEYSIDDGQNWQTEAVFHSLTAGIYQPRVKAVRLGCPLVKSASALELLPATALSLQLDLPPNACEGEDVLLKIASPYPLPPNSAFQWSGPAGFSSPSFNPVLPDVKSYQSGSYTLVLNAEGCEPAIASKILTVNSLPEPPTLQPVPSLCSGEKFELKTDVPAEKYEWIGPLGQSAATLAIGGLTTTTNYTNLGPGHPAYLSGSWRVRVTDAAGCRSESEPTDILIRPRPQAFAENTGAVCPGESGQLLSNPLPGAVYRWRRMGQSQVFSMQPNPVAPNISAAQTFELQIEQDGCLSENLAKTTISLNPTPSASPAFNYEKADDCSPQDLELTGNASGMNLSYQWSGPNGFVSQAVNPVISGAAASANGAYHLEVANFFGCTVSAGVLVAGIVNPVAMPVVQSSGSACPGDQIQLSVQPYGGSSVDFQWYKNNLPLLGQISNLLNLNAVQTADAGNYRVKVQVDGCLLQSAEMPVNVLSLPNALPDFSLSQPCEGGALQFFSNTSGITAWQWTGPNGFASSSPTPLIYNTQFDDVGAYTLTVTGLNGCKSTSTIVVDGILPRPEMPLVATNSPVCPEGEIKLQVQNPAVLGSVFYDWVNGNGENIGDGSASLVLAPDSPEAVQPFLVRSIVNTCPSPYSNSIAVELKPAPVAIAWNGGAICTGETAELFASSVPGGVYEWRIAGTGQLISVEQNPNYILHDSALFELIVKINGCQAEATTTTLVPVNPAPAIVGMTGGGSYCEGTPVILSAANSVPFNGSVQYTWTGPGGFSYTASANAEGPFPLVFGEVQPQQSGAFTLGLESPEGCLSAPESVALQVGTMAPAPVLDIADPVLCQGETLELNANPYSGNDVEYRWYFNDGQADYLIGITAFPTYFLPSVMPSNSGTYFLMAKVDGCEPPQSNLKIVTVLGTATSIQVNDPASTTDPACEGSEVQLEATLIPGAGYTWYGPAGFQSNVPNPLIEHIKPNQQGAYLVVVDLPGCDIAVTGSASLFVQPVPPTPWLTGESSACEGSETLLSVGNAAPGGTYSFFFGSTNQPLSEGENSFLTLSGLTAAQTGTYYVLSSVNGCQSDISAGFELKVIPQQEGTAFAGDDQIICSEKEKPLLQAAQPLNGSGYWTSLDGAFALQPTLAASYVGSLQPGANRFVWTLENGVCPGAGVDTVTLFFEKIEAQPDLLLMTDNDSLLTVNILENDEVENAPDREFSILKKPVKGVVSDDGLGNIAYRPYPHSFGTDEFIYLLCSMNCSEVCDTALVRIELPSATNSSQCFIPNLISPNGDGESDTFIIPCAAGFPGSSLTIFNRWGSKVFETGNYQNDWDGSYDGHPLPVGTYFYRLSLNDQSKTVLSGYVAIIR